jgi:hypothetical protein
MSYLQKKSQEATKVVGVSLRRLKVTLKKRKIPLKLG